MSDGFDAVFNTGWSMSETKAAVDTSFNPRADLSVRPHTSPGTFHGRTDLIENVDEDDYRTKPEYHAYYYSLNPRDPRLPVPITKGRKQNSQDEVPEPSKSDSQRTTTPPQNETRSRSPQSTHQPYQPVTPEFLPKNLLSENTPEAPSLTLPTNIVDEPKSFSLVSEEPRTTPAAAKGGAQYSLGHVDVGSMNSTGLQQQQQQAYIPLQFVAQPAPMVTVGQAQPVLLQMSATNNAVIPVTFKPYNQPQHTQQGSAAQGEQSKPGRHAVANNKPRSAPSHTSSTRQKSELLMEFLDNPKQNWRVTDLENHIVEFSKDQDGSRLIQRLMETDDSGVSIIFGEIRPALKDLVTDVFGNYVVQKLLECGTNDVRAQIVASMRGEVLSLALQTYGCRVVQKAFDHSPQSLQMELAMELKGSVPQCVLDQNANHVIQKCIETMPRQCQFVIDSFLGRVQELSCHAYGCRVLQRIFEMCTRHIDLQPLLSEVLSNAKALVSDQYGNYVIQHALINSKRDVQAQIIEIMTPRVKELACSKFASNVAEKMFEFASPPEFERLFQTVLHGRDEHGNSPLVCMMQDQFANYVVQRLINVSSPAQRQEIVDHITPQIPNIRRFTYGRHILARLEKMGMLPASMPMASDNRGYGNDRGGDNLMPIGMNAHSGQGSHHHGGHSHHQGGHHSHHQGGHGHTHGGHNNHGYNNDYRSDYRGGRGRGGGGRGGRGRGGGRGGAPHNPRY